MRKMKDSGIAWIGEMPEEWQVKRLRFTGQLCSAGVDKKIREDTEDVSEDKREYLYKSIHYTDVYAHSESEIGNSEDYLVISATKKKAAQCALNEGDILFTSSSETPEDIGHSTEVAENMPNVLFGYHLTRFRPSEGFAKGFLKYLLGSSYMRSWFAYRAYGMTRYGISYTDFADACILIPPMHEQERITHFLDARCSVVNAAMEKEQSVIDQLTAYKQSLITETVTHGLHPEVPLRNGGVEWIGEIPTHWQINRLGWHTDALTPMRDRPADLTGDIPWVRIEDYDGKYIERSKEGLGVSQQTVHDMNLKIYPVGSVLCTSSCDLGKCAIVKRELVSNQRFIDIIPREGLKTDFLYYLMLSNAERLNVLSTGTIQANLSRKEFEHLKVQVPPENEQKEIADYLDAKCAAIDADIAKRRALIDQLADYKRSLIYEVVTGKREVE